MKMEYKNNVQIEWNLCKTQETGSLGFAGEVGDDVEVGLVEVWVQPASHRSRSLLKFGKSD